MTASPHVREAGNTPARRHPHLRLVTPGPQRHTRSFALLLALLAIAAVFATVAVNALGAADALTARTLQAEVAEAERRHAELVAEVAALEHPGRVEAVAVDELGMVVPTDARFLVLGRALPEDGRRVSEIVAGEEADPLKPILSVER
jgi:cell division protein FtsL